MNTLRKSWFLWLITIVFTLAISVYQRITGPTKPVRGTVELSGEKIRYRLLRSHETGIDAPVRIKVMNPEITGTYQFKRFKSYDEWETRPLSRQGDYLYAYIPQQPPAGKVEYRITLEHVGQSINLTDNPVIIRFKGAVPSFWLLPHIIFMFIAMLVSTRTGLEALTGNSRIYQFSLLTLVSLFIGGIVLGPIVQKYAFGAYWTGWPVGTDLTDNKTAIAFIFWIIAVVKTYRNRHHRGWAIGAAVVMLFIYLIPHSLMGSELDYRN